MIQGPFEKQVFLLGLSTDTKPTTYLTGTEFLETDTGVRWIFTGTTWVPYISENAFAISSGLKNASAAIIAGPALLVGFSLVTNGAADATLILYDNATTNSGTELGKAIVLAASMNFNLAYNIPVRALNGIYLALSGAGATAIVFYTPR